MSTKPQTNDKPMPYSDRYQYSRLRRSTRWVDGSSCFLSGSSSIFVSGRSLVLQEYPKKHKSALRYPSARWWHIARKRQELSDSLAKTLEIWGLTVCGRGPSDRLLLPGIRPHAVRFNHPVQSVRTMLGHYRWQLMKRNERYRHKDSN